MTQYVFYFLSGVTILTALLVIFAKNPVHSVLYLILCFFSISGHYVLLDAQFLAIVNLIVYAGAVMVLFLFVVMMLNLNAESDPTKPKLIKFAAVVSGGLLMLVIIASIKYSENNLPITANADATMGNVKNLGKALFTDFLLPFEVCSILFIAAMVGAVVLGKRENENNQ